jgi:hypothetical protein
MFSPAIYKMVKVAKNEPHSGSTTPIPSNSNHGFGGGKSVTDNLLHIPPSSPGPSSSSISNNESLNSSSSGNFGRFLVENGI